MKFAKTERKKIAEFPAFPKSESLFAFLQFHVGCSKPLLLVGNPEKSYYFGGIYITKAITRRIIKALEPFA